MSSQGLEGGGGMQEQFLQNYRRTRIAAKKRGKLSWAARWQESGHVFLYQVLPIHRLFFIHVFHEDRRSHVANEHDLVGFFFHGHHFPPLQRPCPPTRRPPLIKRL